VRSACFLDTTASRLLLKSVGLKKEKNSLVQATANPFRVSLKED
jgi:hypothetical protein